MATATRGSALLNVIIVLLIVSLLSAGVMLLSGKQLSGARQRETAVGLSSCAQAVRQYIGSQITAKVNATCPSTDWPCGLSFTVPGTQTAITLQGGHNIRFADGGPGWPDPNFKLTAVSPLGGAGSSIENLANAMPLTLGKTLTPTSGSAVCTDASGRTYEVEFSFISG
jgi:type II secretory pathway pseudopilin PulG